MTGAEVARMRPNSMADLWRWCETAAAANIVPTAFRGKPNDIMLAVGLGEGMGLTPAESLYRIHVIEGKPTASAELIASNVRRSGHVMRVTGDAQSCTAEIIRKDDPKFTHRKTFSMEDAKRAGLLNKSNWSRYPAAMLEARAVSAVARSACPEALYGVIYTPEEMGSEAGPGDVAGDEPAGVDAPAPTEPEPEPKPVANPKRSRKPKAEPEPAPTPAEGPEGPPEMATEEQLTMLRAAVAVRGLTNDEAVEFIELITNRAGAKTNNLHHDEAAMVIDALGDIEPAHEGGDEEPPW